MTLTRTLATALAAAALTAPAAVAQPADIQPTVAHVDKQHARPNRTIRTPTRRLASTRPLPGPPTWPSHRQPITTRVEAPTRPLPALPTWPSIPAPITAPAAATHHGDDRDAATIGLGIAGSLLAVGAIGLGTNPNRRTRRRHTPA